MESPPSPAFGTPDLARTGPAHKKKDRCNHGSESHAAATKKEIVSSFAEGESLFRPVYSNIHESFTPPPQNVFALSLVMGLRLAACTPCLREAAKPRRLC